MMSTQHKSIFDDLEQSDQLRDSIYWHDGSCSWSMDKFANNKTAAATV